MLGDPAIMRRLLSAPAHELGHGVSSVTWESDEVLFRGGPLYRAYYWFGLGWSEPRYVVRRALLAVIIGWVPLVILTAIQSMVLDAPGLETFGKDMAAHGRLLVAVPVLILAELSATLRLSVLGDYFLDSGIVPEGNRARFAAARASTRRLRDSRAADYVVLVLAYCVAIALLLFVPQYGWQRAGSGAGLSPAGWYHALVSVPLLAAVLLAWAWRLFLWARFLRLISQLDLRLVPGHPDLSGGLKFIGYSVVEFAPVAFALGAIFAGMVAKQIFHGEMDLFAGGVVAIVLAILVVVFFVGPLLVFAKPLIAARRRGLLRYGSLARSVGDAFERKWVAGVPLVHESALESQDFSATTDLFQVVSNVYAMRIVPIELWPIGVLLAAALIPFSPAALVTLSLTELLARIGGFLF
jgi:hypothetical protein